MKIFTLLFLAFSLQAKIIQTNRMEDIVPYVDETTWVLFDVDHTLMEPASHVGREEFFFHQVRELMAEENLDWQTADDRIFPERLFLEQFFPIRSPEPNVPALVQTLQQKSSASFALTARPPFIAQRTLEQLNKLNIDFSSSAPSPVPLETSHPTHWEQGILFISIKNSKGTIFRQFLEKSPDKPTKIVFIDDTKRHLDHMEEALEGLDVEFIGFHYTKKLETPFDLELAIKEYREMREQHQNN